VARNTVEEQRHQRLIRFLVAERKKRQIQQFQLANRLEVSQTWIARVESGKRRVDIFEFIDIAKAIGINPSKCVRWLCQMEPDKRGGNRKRGA
jgi:transcriptional regulator with XRE-family HTH domain